MALHLMAVYGMVAHVADWIGKLIDRPVGRLQGWEYLRQMTFRWRQPRPQHREADMEEQQQWKKN